MRPYIGETDSEGFAKGESAVDPEIYSSGSRECDQSEARKRNSDILLQGMENETEALDPEVYADETSTDDSSGDDEVILNPVEGLQPAVEIDEQRDQPGENAESEQPRVPPLILVDPPHLPSPPRNSRRNQGEEQEVISLETPSPPKKRKRLSAAADKSLKKSPEGKPIVVDDEDDGMTCPICLDSWEMSGEHRLVSLRCGHLFGESCIRRWLNESHRQSSVKVCPQCKTKATFRDIRHLYAKRIQMLDTDIREQLEAERRRTHTLTTELATAKLANTLTTEKLILLQKDYERLKELVRAGGGRGAFGGDASGQKSIQQLATYRLYMEKNFEITRDPGCRVLLYSAKHSMLVASQKSAQNLFPGYGVRFIDPPTFKPLQFLHTSALLIRDIAFSDSQHLLTVASRELKIKIFDIRTRLCSSMFTAHDKMLWSCALIATSANTFYTAEICEVEFISTTCGFPRTFSASSKPKVSVMNMQTLIPA